MTEDRIQKPCLDEKGIKKKRICNDRQCLERLEQYTKRKYKTDIAPLIKEKTTTETECKTEKQDTKKLSSGTEIQSNAPKNKVRIPNRTGQN